MKVEKTVQAGVVELTNQKKKELETENRTYRNSFNVKKLLKSILRTSNRQNDSTTQSKKTASILFPSVKT